MIQKDIDALFSGLCLEPGSGRVLFSKHRDSIKQVKPANIVASVDKLILGDIPMVKVKKGISKALNLLHETLVAIPFPEVEKDGFFDLLLRNYEVFDKKLKGLRPVIRELNKENENFPENQLKKIRNQFQSVQKLFDIYVLMENVVFPILEKRWPDYRCVHVMWSIHDDIRKNIKELDVIIGEAGKAGIMPGGNKINRILGDLYFDIYAIKFRIERILIPLILETIGEQEINEAFNLAGDLHFPYFDQERQSLIQEKIKNINENKESISGRINLPNGSIDPDIINLMLNNLPVDFSYVDENDEVIFYSDPPHRIFPRTPAVIGRKVQNCHPKESISIVNKIIDEFKMGEKDSAEFWINHGSKKILISYFAIREMGKYRGVLEVSQDITGMDKYQDEKRLLNW